MNLSSWTHILGQIANKKKGAYLSFVRKWQRSGFVFRRGYEPGVVTPVSEGISGAPQPGRFLSRGVTVSGLEL